MNATVISPVEELLEAAKRLTHEQRLDLYDLLSVELDMESASEDEGPPLSPEWMAEIERRIAEDDAGLTQWHPIEEVLAEGRESLKSPA